VSVLRLCHLYPHELNIYADRGNIAVFHRRLAWRGLRLEVIEVGVGERIPADADVYYLGGGQDRDQAIVATDLRETKAVDLAAAAAAGAVVFAVCGGYQLAGHGYTGVDGSRMPGVSLLDADTIAGTTRLIGDLVIEAEIDGERQTVVGFENHAGRTRLGPGARPLGRVVSGNGNNGEDSGEGAVQGRVVGTYLHGPLLPKNPWLADRLLGWGLEHATGRTVELDPIDDALESMAHTAAIARARRPRR
jgi:lipid II isoglutaminyl synthase (glutamine-hydrolysing)